MKGIYLLIRTEKLSLCQTRASLANVRVHSVQKYGDSLRARADCESANNLNNEVFSDLWCRRTCCFIISFSLMPDHDILCGKCWCMKSAEKTSCIQNTVDTSCIFYFTLEYLLRKRLLLTCVLFLCRILWWASQSSCEARSRKNSTGLSTCTTSIKMDISLKRCVPTVKCHQTIPSFL